MVSTVFKIFFFILGVCIVVYKFTVQILTQISHHSVSPFGASIVW